MSALTTYTGKHLDPLDPDPDMICIEDIAHALSNIGRYGGHADVFYSVAQHCTIMASYCPPTLAPACLMHDAAEAYVGDLVRPIKHGTELGDLFTKVEDNLLTIIFQKFDIPVAHLHLVEYWDKWMLRWEQRSIRPRTLEADGPWYPHAMLLVPDYDIAPMPSGKAKGYFLNLAAYLVGPTAVAA